MTVSQTQFRDAILNADLPVPHGLQDASGRPAGARFSVYRNNVVVSLTEAMTAAFPLVSKLLGPETFGKLAGLYVRAHPPSSPLMMFYGAEFPEFLTVFEPLKHIGYLPDCARLDAVMRTSYHAADAAAFDPTELTGAKAPALQLRLAPSSQIVRSNWPIHDIWRYNTEDNAPKPRPVAQDVLVTRPDLDPIPYVLPPGAADWIERLDKGTPFETACDAILEQTPAFDLQESLTLVLSSKALTKYTAKDN